MIHALYFGSKTTMCYRKESLWRLCNRIWSIAVCSVLIWVFCCILLFWYQPILLVSLRLPLWNSHEYYGQIYYANLNWCKIKLHKTKHTMYISWHIVELHRYAHFCSCVWMINGWWRCRTWNVHVYKKNFLHMITTYVSPTLNPLVNGWCLYQYTWDTETGIFR